MLEPFVFFVVAGEQRVRLRVGHEPFASATGTPGASGERAPGTVVADLRAAQKLRVLRRVITRVCRKASGSPSSFTARPRPRRSAPGPAGSGCGRRRFTGPATAACAPSKPSASQKVPRLRADVLDRLRLLAPTLAGKHGQATRPPAKRAAERLEELAVEDGRALLVDAEHVAARPGRLRGCSPLSPRTSTKSQHSTEKEPERKPAACTGRVHVISATVAANTQHGASRSRAISSSSPSGLVMLEPVTKPKRYATAR